MWTGCASNGSVCYVIMNRSCVWGWPHVLGIAPSMLNTLLAGARSKKGGDNLREDADSEVCTRAGQQAPKSSNSTSKDQSQGQSEQTVCDMEQEKEARLGHPSAVQDQVWQYAWRDECLQASQEGQRSKVV